MFRWGITASGFIVPVEGSPPTGGSPTGAGSPTGDEFIYYFYTDFSEYSVGSRPSDWTDREITASEIFVIAEPGSPDESTGGAMLSHPGGGGDTLSWDVTPQGSPGVIDDDVEVLIRARTQDFDNYECGPWLRMTGNAHDGDLSGYFFALDYDDKITVIKIRDNGGTETSVVGATTSAGSGVWDDWFWLRARVTGSDAAIKCKLWKQGENEPGSWMLDTTDPETNSVPITTGDVGFRSTIDCDIDIFSVALDGNTALDTPQT